MPKKSVSHYIKFLITSSVALSLLLTFFLKDTAMKIDDPRCELIKYSISSSCRDGSVLKIKIKNENFEKAFYINTGEEEKLIPPGKETEIRVYDKEGGKVTLIPFLKYGANEIICNGKKKVTVVYQKC